MPFTYDYPRPAVTTDCLIFKCSQAGDALLLIRRGRPPYQGMWALPGGFMEMDETLEQTALRELEEETGLKGIRLEQFRAFSGLDRDPRQRTIGIVFYGFADEEAIAKAGDDAADADWFSLEKLPPLAFDHNLVTHEALQMLAKWKQENGRDQRGFESIGKNIDY